MELRSVLIDRKVLFVYGRRLLRENIPEGEPTLSEKMDKDVQNRVNEIISVMREHHADENVFLAELTKWGFTLDTLYQKLYTRESESVIIDIALLDLVKVTAEEVRQYKEVLKSEKRPLFRYRLRFIFFEVPADATREQRDKVHIEAIEVGMKIEKGVLTMPEAVIKYSDAPDAKQSMGIVEYMDSTDFEPAIAKALARTKEGQMTIPIETERGFHIFKVLRKLDAEDFLLDRKYKDLKDFVLKEQKEKTKIKLYDFY
jgi:hypothetical protein